MSCQLCGLATTDIDGHYDRAHDTTAEATERLLDKGRESLAADLIEAAKALGQEPLQIGHQDDPVRAMREGGYL